MKMREGKISEREVRSTLEKHAQSLGVSRIPHENPIALLKHICENGRNREGTNSKTYTGPALEVFSKYCVQTALNAAGIETAEMNDNYIEDQLGELDSLRLDLHVHYDGKIILAQECRAWMDKPFCTTKYQVIGDFVFLPHSRSVLSKNVVFPITTFCCDTSEKTIRTREKFLDMVLENSKMSQKNAWGCRRVSIFKFSTGKSRSNGGYFKGVDEREVKRYMEFLINHFKHFKEEI